MAYEISEFKMMIAKGMVLDHQPSDRISEQVILCIGERSEWFELGYHDHDISPLMSRVILGFLPEEKGPMFRALMGSDLKLYESEHDFCPTWEELDKMRENA